MPVEVREAEDGDMDRVFEICSLAFADNEPLWDYMWPKHWEAAGRKQGAERMRGIRKNDPNTKFILGVDSETVRKPTTVAVRGLRPCHMVSERSLTLGFITSREISLACPSGMSTPTTLCLTWRVT